VATRWWYADPRSQDLGAEMPQSAAMDLDRASDPGIVPHRITKLPRCAAQLHRSDADVLLLRAVTSQGTGTSVQSRCSLPQLTSQLPQQAASMARLHWESTSFIV